MKVLRGLVGLTKTWTFSWVTLIPGGESGGEEDISGRIWSGCFLASVLKSERTKKRVEMMVIRSKSK